MFDYNKLIERLRFYSRQGTRYGMAVITMADAADAIEFLIKDRDFWKDAAIKAKDES